MLRQLGADPERARREARALQAREGIGEEVEVLNVLTEDGPVVVPLGDIKHATLVTLAGDVEGQIVSVGKAVPRKPNL